MYSCSASNNSSISISNDSTRQVKDYNLPLTASQYPIYIFVSVVTGQADK